MNRLALALVLLAGSLTLSGILFFLGIPFFALLLFIPLVPLLGSRRPVRTCPSCGWETTGTENFCPCDGVPLTRAGE